MSLVNWRTIDIDALDPESAANFDLTTLTPGVVPVSSSDVQTLGGQIRQLLRGGDAEGALRELWKMHPTELTSEGSGNDCSGILLRVRRGLGKCDEVGSNKSLTTECQETHLATVIEILQSIRQSEMSPMLGRIYQSDGGTELLDALMKYLYKGMSQTAGAPSKPVAPQSTGFSQIHSRVGAGETSGQAMSVLLSWHEKLVDIAGPGSIVRVMTDRRTV